MTHTEEAFHAQRNAWDAERKERADSLERGGVDHRKATAHWLLRGEGGGDVLRERTKKIHSYATHQTENSTRMMTDIAAHHAQAEVDWTDEWLNRGDLPWNTWLSSEAASKLIAPQVEPGSALASMMEMSPTKKRWQPAHQSEKERFHSDVHKGSLRDVGVDKGSPAALRAQNTSHKAALMGLQVQGVAEATIQMNKQVKELEALAAQEGGRYDTYVEREYARIHGYQEKNGLGGEALSWAAFDAASNGAG